MSDSNALSRPLGNNVPLPGGDQVDTPQQRLTLPGGSPGGGGNPTPPASPQLTGGVGDLPSPQMSFDGSRRTLMQQHLRNKAAFEATGKALKQLDHIRKGLERLADKQDIVTIDDVVDEAGKLVAHGIDPVALAGILADAPQEGGGEALGGWVASHAQTAAMAEQKLMVEHSVVQHMMGVSAMHLLMAHANSQMMLGPMAPPVQQPGGPDNSLATQDSPDLTDNPEHSPANMLAHGQRFMGR